MGAGQSGGFEIGGSSMGYQVLRVYPNSPGSQAGLKAYFDFIVAIGNTRFNKEDGSLREILKASVDQKLKMVVFNTRNKQPREVEIVPTTSWGGSGLLGVSIKHSSFDKADERVWHVVEVDSGSPAQQAGLKATEDYVIGSDSILQESDDLYNLIEAHEGKALKLFVYNSKSDNCREVICHPNSRWGGRGFLGCEFGHGLLHRIPYADSQMVGGDVKSALQGQSSQQQQNYYGNLARPPTMTQQQQSVPAPQLPLQPGNQMFQQALFSQTPASQVQQQPKSNIASQQHSPNSLPPPPESLTNVTSQNETFQSAPVLPHPNAPQTFAQLANAQSQARQEQQYYQQKQQPQQHQHQQQQPPPPPPPQQQQHQPAQHQQQPHQHQQPQQQPPPPPPHQQPTQHLQHQHQQQSPQPQHLQQSEQQLQSHQLQQCNHQQNPSATNTGINFPNFSASEQNFTQSHGLWTATNGQSPVLPQQPQNFALPTLDQMRTNESVPILPQPSLAPQTFAQLAHTQTNQDKPPQQGNILQPALASSSQTPNQTLYQQQFFQQPQQFQP